MTTPMWYIQHGHNWMPLQMIDVPTKFDDTWNTSAGNHPYHRDHKQSQLRLDQLQEAENKAPSLSASKLASTPQMCHQERQLLAIARWHPLPPCLRSQSKHQMRRYASSQDFCL